MNDLSRLCPVSWECCLYLGGGLVILEGVDGCPDGRLAVASQGVVGVGIDGVWNRYGCLEKLEEIFG